MYHTQISHPHHPRKKCWPNWNRKSRIDVMRSGYGARVTQWLNHGYERKEQTEEVRLRIYHHSFWRELRNVDLGWSSLIHLGGRMGNFHNGNFRRYDARRKRSGKQWAVARVVYTPPPPSWGNCSPHFGIFSMSHAPLGLYWAVPPSIFTPYGVSYGAFPWRIWILQAYDSRSTTPLSRQTLYVS